MNDQAAFRIKTFIKPFERALALKEIDALVDGGVRPKDGSSETATTFVANKAVDIELLRQSLAYWHSAGVETNFTSQLRREATSLIARNGLSVEDIPTKAKGLVPDKLPNSRCLRYATHGIHEYRGKFFPQLVKALMNIAKMPAHGSVLDPMCGSGTTLVEAKLAGHTALGVDMNPLSVFLTSVKCDLLEIQSEELVSSFKSLRGTLHKIASAGRQSYSHTLSASDQAYLDRWFATSTLVELDAVISAVDEMDDRRVREFFRVCLSNIIRWASLQKEADLRVRREVKTFEVGEVLDRFLDEALRSTKLVAAFLAENSKSAVGRHQATNGDARTADEVFAAHAGTVDAVITSPPYATALPYLDTDRLSLIYLGLLSRSDHRERDLDMIGNREVTDGQRREAWEFYATNSQLLPKSIQELVEKIDRLNSGDSVGFRRRNLAALLSRYFFDMREVMIASSRMLRQGGAIFMVVGNNRTTAGGEDIAINTAELLIDLGRELGLVLAENIPMDMLVSRDIFRTNAMPSEQIFRLMKA